jgi:hypothetical protein
MDVRVGLISMKNKGSGKGLQTKEEQGMIDGLLKRNKKPPTGINDPSRMLQDLEDAQGWQG